MRKWVLSLGICFAVVTGVAHADDRIKVYKPDGTLQCGQGDEIPIREMAKDLRKAGVGILSSRKGHDGRFRTTMCGASTGNINIFSIRASDGPLAAELGFRKLRDET